MTQGLVPFPQMFTPATAEQFNAQEFQIADVLGLKTTTWQQGDPSRTILAVVANLLMLQDVDISILAQGGFLDFAATGTVVYRDPVSGVEVIAYVTPDPSDPAQNPTGQLGALDVLANSVYNVDRTLKTPAGGTLAIVNTSLSTYGPYDPGGFHVSQPLALGSPTYNNVASLTIAPSPIAGTLISSATNATPIVITTTTPHGLADGDLVFVDGVLVNTAANGFWFIDVTGANTFKLLGSVGNGGPSSGGKVYVPQQEAFTADTAGSASTAAASGVVSQAVTSLVGVTVWNTAPWIGSDTENNLDLVAKCRLKLQSLSPNGPRGAYEFFAKQAFLLAPLLTPPLSLSTPIAKALVVPDYFTGTVTTTVADAGGAPPPDDVTSTDAVIHAFCVPQAITAITQGAVDHPIAVVINVWLPAAYVVASTQTTIQAAVTSYFAALPIGGVTDPTESPGPNTNVVPYNAVLGAVWEATKAAKIPVQQLTGTLDDGGGAAALNIQLALTPIPEVATLDGPVSVTAIPI